MQLTDSLFTVYIMILIIKMTVAIVLKCKKRMGGRRSAEEEGQTSNG